MKKLLALSLIACLTFGFAGCNSKQEKYYGLLAEYSDYNREDAVDYEFTYDFDDAKLAALDVKWDLSGTAGEGDTQSRALNLLHWLCAHTIKGNPKSLPEGLEMHADSLLDWCFDQPGNDPNCMYLSITLSECLLAVGIKAYALWCYPKVDKGENHVVVQVWLPEEERWIMLDPSFDLYVMDEAGRTLDTQAFRQSLAERKPLHLNEGHTYNGSYFDYMAIDTFYFDRVQDMRYGVVEEGGTFWLSLCPAGYDLAEEDGPMYATYSSFWR